MLAKSRLEKIMLHLLSLQYKHLFLKFKSHCINSWETLQIYILKNDTMGQQSSNPCAGPDAMQIEVWYIVLWHCVLGILMGNQNRPFIIDSRLRINHLFNNWKLKPISPVRLYWCSCVLILPHAQPCLTITQTFWCSRVFRDSHLH